MKTVCTIKNCFKFELKNILRSRWLFGFTILTALLTQGLLSLTEDPAKVLVSLSLILPVLLSLVVLVFSTLHWYYNENFTVLLLIQPVSRKAVLISRYLALGFALASSFLVGLIAPFVVQGSWPEGLLSLLATLATLIFIFVGAAMAIAALVKDRLKGIGLALGLWLYLSLIHDGLLLLLLVTFRHSPLDNVAGLIAAINPISLSRVLQLINFDQALLLSHTGALTQQILVSWKGYGVVAFSALGWLLAPSLHSLRGFQRRDL